MSEVLVKLEKTLLEYLPSSHGVCAERIVHKEKKMVDSKNCFMIEF